MTSRALVALVIGGVGAGVLAPAAWAQEGPPPYDPAIDVQLFEYSLGPKTFFAVNDAAIMAPKQLTFDAFLTFITDPFTVYNLDRDEMIEGERTQVVKQVLAGELSAAYGLNDRFQLGVGLPIVFSMTGDGLMPADASPSAEGLRISGTGDLRAEVKMKVQGEGPIRIATAVGLTAPTSFGSGGSAFIGDDLPSLRGRGIAQWTSRDAKLSFGANLGVIFRKPRKIFASTIGQQLTWGVAASYRPAERFALIAEGFGRAGLQGFALDQSPVELEGGARVQATQAVAVVVGGGAGVVRGIGSPDLRLFVSVGYAPDTRDTDGDGVANNRDRCPAAAEDRDSHADGDGCPDDDNDGDRRDDAKDRCPDESEDFDGYDDDDGCPELDNDGDEIPDLQDKCTEDREDKAEPFPTDGCPADKHDADNDGLVDLDDTCPADTEDVDGFEDADGCPDLDQDQDQVGDEVDVCPLCAEDPDGFEDEDGCPEGDNDKDGIADLADDCPIEAETVNGYDDFDGCADDGGVLLVELRDDRIAFIRQPSFDRRGALDRAGGIIVDQLALVMLQHREITKWALAAAARTKDVADRQAASIRARLLERGILPESIEVGLTGAGDPAIAVLISERAEAAGPSCPAALQVQPRPFTPKPRPGAATPGAATPAPAPASPPKPAPAAPPAAAPPAAAPPAAAPAPPKPPAGGAADELK